MIPFKKYKLAGGLIILLIIIFTGSIIFEIIKSEKSRRTFLEVSNSLALNGIVLNKEVERTASIVTLNINKTYMLFWADNYNYSPYQLSEFLQIGDSISKNENSDTLYIYRQNSLYYFRLCKIIGK